jgi:hypothetical protein
LDLWTSGYQWVKLNKSVLSIEHDDYIEYFIAAGDETKTTNADIYVMKKMKWYAFDQYKTRAFNTWSVTLPMDQSKWLDGICKPPPAAKNVPIGEKRRRSRPSKVKKALLIQ